MQEAQKTAESSFLPADKRFHVFSFAKRQRSNLRPSYEKMFQGDCWVDTQTPSPLEIASDDGGWWSDQGEWK